MAKAHFEVMMSVDIQDGEIPLCTTIVTKAADTMAKLQPQTEDCKICMHEHLAVPHLLPKLKQDSSYRRFEYVPQYDGEDFADVVRLCMCGRVKLLQNTLYTVPLPSRTCRAGRGLRLCTFRGARQIAVHRGSWTDMVQTSLEEHPVGMIMRPCIIVK